MNSARNDAELPAPGFPIRKSPDQSLLSGSPKLIAASHALHRLLAPRHSPCALSSLTHLILGKRYHSRFSSLSGYPYAIVKELGVKGLEPTPLERADPRCTLIESAQRATNARKWS